ncbi:MAG: hypothetical protein RBU27_12455 [Bacteroidota bacterium]|nr:hypothetical protein [Bacteroidota bacterium]
MNTHQHRRPSLSRDAIAATRGTTAPGAFPATSIARRTTSIARRTTSIARRATSIARRATSIARRATVLMCLVVSACTDNPFEDSTAVASAHRSISGHVRLSDRAEHAGVHIWLEGFDLHTETRADGGFSLTLPPASAQSVPGGVDGVFLLHAFLGNYRTRSIPTAIRDGVFTFPTDEIDADGAIRETLFLQQLFSIRTTLSRDRIEADSPRVITVTVSLRSPVPPVEIHIPRMVGAMEGPVLLHNITTGTVDLFETVITSIEPTEIVHLGPTEFRRSMILIIPRGRLKAGEYRIVPFLLPRNSTVPLALLASLGDSVTLLGPDYLRYPLLRDGGRLLVEPN